MKKILKGLIVLLIMASLIGCSMPSATDMPNAKTLTVYLDTSVMAYKPVMDKILSDFSQKTNIQIQILQRPDVLFAEDMTLSNESQEAINFLQPIRSDIMSGSGPDVFIGNLFEQFFSQEYDKTMLLGNSYKTMKTGTLLDVSDFINNSDSFDNYNKALLNAGKIDSKVYYVPLAYTLDYVILTDDNNFTDLSCEAVLTQKNITQENLPKKPQAFLDSVSNNLQANFSFNIKEKPDAIVSNLKYIYDSSIIDFRQNNVAIDANEIYNTITHFQIYPYCLGEDFVATILPVSSINSQNEFLKKGYGVPIPNQAEGYTAKSSIGVCINNNTPNLQEALLLLEYLATDLQVQTKLSNSFGFSTNNQLTKDEIDTLNIESRLFKQNIFYSIDNITNCYFVNDMMELLQIDIANSLSSEADNESLLKQIQDTFDEIQFIIEE